MTSEEIIAVITARKNSKSIKNKNMIKINSKPLIDYSFDICKKSKFIDRIILSSDSEEIINFSKKKGIEVPFKRPKKYSLDHSTDLEVFSHLLNFLLKKKMRLPKFFIHVRPTCPIRNIKTFDSAIKFFSDNLKKKYTSLRSISLSKENPYKMWCIKNNRLVSVIPNNKFNSIPRQLIPKTYWQNGYIDIITPKTILNGSMEGNKILPFIIDEQIHDIDYLSDLKNFKKFLLDKSSNDRTHPS